MSNLRRHPCALFTRVLLILVLATSGARIAVSNDDYASLVKGISDVDTGSAGLGEIVLFGGDAFPLILDPKSGRNHAAVSTLGKGRIVAFAHSSYLNADPEKMPLIQNAIHWSAGGKPRGGSNETDRTVVGTLSPKWAKALNSRNIEARVISLGEKIEVDVVCTARASALKPEEVQALRSFLMERGGGLVVATTPWSVKLDPGKNPRPPAGDQSARFVKEFGLNQVLEGSGLIYSPTYPYFASGKLPVSPIAPSPLLNGATALDAAISHLSGGSESKTLNSKQEAQAAEIASSVLQLLSFNDPRLTNRARKLEKLAATRFPSPERKINLTKAPLLRLLLEYETLRTQQLPPQRLKAHPGADAFPGAVPRDAERVTETVKINASTRAFRGNRMYANAGAAVWRSTGLYAAPGELVTITIPELAVDAGLRVLIGAHTDSIAKRTSVPRLLRVSRSFALDRKKVEAANAFGGLIYIQVPVISNLGTIPVRIGNAVEAPLFLKGKTSEEDWREAIRDNPAPWAEIGSEDKMILTLRSEDIRDLDNPADVVAFWDEVMDHAADLAAMDPDRVRAERIVLDEEISAGLYHSGYPIMGRARDGKLLTDVNSLRAKGIWGYYHEIGHNHQSKPWLIPNTTESSCNLWSMYLFEKMNKLYGTHGAVTVIRRRGRVGAFLKDPQKHFFDWDAWGGLDPYLLLKDAFGWKAYQKAFASYLEKPDNGKLSTMDRWVVEFSLACGKNVAPFYAQFRYTTGDEALARIKHLPAWDVDLKKNPMPPGPFDFRKQESKQPQ